MLARTHTHISNRAKARENTERKAVFKSVLENPFKVSWPSIPVNLQNAILGQLLAVLDHISHYRRENALMKKWTRNAARQSPKKKLTGEHNNKMEADDLSDETANTQADEQKLSEAPSLLKHLVVGINEVTKRLEKQIKSSRPGISISADSVTSDTSENSCIKTIFVCRADVDPSLLISHLPYLMAKVNAAPRFRSSPIKLIPLPKGAELSMAGALGLRRVAVLAIDDDATELSSFSHLFDSIPAITASWMLPPMESKTTIPPKKLVPTRIKQLRTSAPKDIRAAKERRAKARMAAKQKKKKPKKVKLISKEE